MSHGESRDKDTLDDLIACCDIIAFTDGLSRELFKSDRKSLTAVSFCVAVLGEAAKRLSDDFRGQRGSIPWRKVSGMRDRLIHGYDTIDADELWDTATRDVPELLEQLRRIQAEL